MCTYGLALKDVAKVLGWGKPRYGFVLFLSCFYTDNTLFRYCFIWWKLRVKQLLDRLIIAEIRQ